MAMDMGQSLDHDGGAAPSNMAYAPMPGMSSGDPTAAQANGAYPTGAGNPGGGGYPDGTSSFPTYQPTPPRWYFRGEAVWLARNNPNNRNLTSYFNQSNANDRFNDRFMLSTDQVTFPLVSGMRLTLGRYVSERTAIEAGFLGANNWDSRNATRAFPDDANGFGPLFPYWGFGIGPFSTSAFAESNQQVAAYKSSFNSAELNLRHWIYPTTSMVFGLRYINLADEFQLTAFNDSNNVNAGQTGFYRTWTNNNLFGAQIGSEYSHELFTPWLFLSAEFKGAAFVNSSEQRNILFNAGSIFDQRSAREVQFASLGEFTLAMTALVGNHLTLRAGYMFVYLNGVALATDQLDTNPTLANSRNFIAPNGSMTLQGPFAGGEVAW